MIIPNCIHVNGTDCETCSCLYFPGATEDNHYNYEIEWRISAPRKLPKFFKQEVV